MVETNVDDVLSQIEFIQQKDMIDSWFQEKTEKGCKFDYEINSDYSVNILSCQMPGYDFIERNEIPFKINHIGEYSTVYSSSIDERYKLTDNVDELNLWMYVRKNYDVSLLPSKLKELKCVMTRSHSKIYGQLPKGIKKLELHSTFFKKGFEFPKHLKELTFHRVNYFKNVDLENLPKRLKVLNIDSCLGLPFIKFPEGLEELSIAKTKIPKNLKFPESLKRLNLFSCGVGYNDMYDVIPSENLTFLNIRK